jgi:phage regulator Rha-like protein
MFLINTNEARDVRISSLDLVKYSEEIGEPKQHAHILRDIRNMLETLGVRESNFGGSYLTPQNKELPCYYLPRREASILMQGYSVKFAAYVYDRLVELEQKTLAKPLSTFEMIAQMAAKSAQQETLLSLVSNKVAAIEVSDNESALTSVQIGTLNTMLMGLSLDKRRKAMSTLKKELMEGYVTGRTWKEIPRSKYKEALSILDKFK